MYKKNKTSAIAKTIPKALKIPLAMIFEFMG